MIERYERYQLFQEFHDQAKVIYAALAKGDAQHEQFLLSHSFIVTGLAEAMIEHGLPA